MNNGFMSKFLEVRRVAVLGGVRAGHGVSFWAMAGARWRDPPIGLCPRSRLRARRSRASPHRDAGAVAGHDGNATSRTNGRASSGAPGRHEQPSYTWPQRTSGNEVASHATDTPRHPQSYFDPCQRDWCPAPPANAAAWLRRTITGAVVQQGQLLTANVGAWTGTTPIAYSYAWTSGGPPSIGVSSRRHTPDHCGRREADRGRGHRHQPGGGPVNGARRGGRAGPAPAPGQHRARRDLGHAPAGPGPDDDARDVAQQPHLVHRAMGGLRRPYLYPHPRPDRDQLHGGPGDVGHTIEVVRPPSTRRPRLCRRAAGAWPQPPPVRRRRRPPAPPRWWRSPRTLRRPTRA